MSDTEKEILNFFDGKIEELHINFEGPGTEISFFIPNKKLRIIHENATYEFTESLIMMARGK